MNLVFKKLGELVDFKGGGTPSRNVKEYWGKDIPWATVKDLNEGCNLTETQEFITELGLKNSASNLIPKGSIIIPTRMALGKVVISELDVAINQDLKAVYIKNDNLLDPKYLLRFLEGNKENIASMGKGATVKGITLDQLKDINLPLPPLEEQRRIASILDKADAIRQKRQQAIATLDELLQATFIDMFGDPLDNPKKYQMMTLGSITSFENGDRSNNYPSGADVVQEGIPFLSTKNIKGNFFDSSNMQFITQEKFNKLSRGKVSNGDILITLRGTLGSTCIYECEYPQAFINAQMMIIRANQNFMSNRFLHIILSSEAMQKHLKSIGNGAAVQQLTATQLKNISIITPDRNNQEIFIKFYESLQNQKSLLKRALNNADDFFKSLQHRAFNGTL